MHWPPARGLLLGTLALLLLLLVAEANGATPEAPSAATVTPAALEQVDSASSDPPALGPGADAPPLSSPLGTPAAEVLTASFLETYFAAALDLITMNSLSSASSSGGAGSFLTRNWLGLSIGGLLLCGALWLGVARPWRGPVRRRKKAEVDPRTQPLLVEVKRGRLQGQDWVKKNLKKDADGDEAHEFLGPF